MNDFEIDLDFGMEMIDIFQIHQNLIDLKRKKKKEKEKETKHHKMKFYCIHLVVKRH